MIITIKVTPNSIEATGHANYAEHGKDIVCAAVSALLQTLELRGTATKQKGVMKVYCEDKKALELIADGLKQVAENYSECVEVIEC